MHNLQDHSYSFYDILHCCDANDKQKKVDDDCDCDAISLYISKDYTVKASSF